MIHLPKSAKAKVKRQYFQPLSVLSLEFDYRPKASLQRIRDVAISSPFVDIPFSPFKLAMSMFLAELLGHRITMSVLSWSRSPVGSSAMSKLGWFISARAMETRRISPPDSSRG